MNTTITWHEGRVMKWMLNEPKKQAPYLKYVSNFRLNDRNKTRTSNQPQSSHRMKISYLLNPK